MGVYIGNKFVEYVKTRTVVSNPLLTFTWSDHLINDSCWLRADTFSWQSGDVYKSVYNELSTQAAEWLETHDYTTDYETENGVNFWRTSKGYKIAIYDGNTEEEQRIINCFNTTGIAWFYLLDRVNKRFKLPRTKFGFDGLRTNVGDDIAESLPSIQAPIGTYWGGGSGSNGSSSIIGQTNTTGTRTLSDANYTYAEVKNNIYKDNAPVQERATQMYLYFFVGNTVYNESIIDIGGITDALNAKVDLDFNNVKSYDNLISHVSPGITANVLSGVAPDYNRAFAISSPYTPQEDGWVFAYSGSADWHRVSLSVNGTTFLYTGRKSYNTGTCMTAFVAKGQQISFTADGGVCRFVPCKSISK